MTRVYEDSAPLAFSINFTERNSKIFVRLKATEISVKQLGELGEMDSLPSRGSSVVCTENETQLERSTEKKFSG